MDVVDNEGIRGIRAPSCLLCSREGRLLFDRLRDPIFGVPGAWGMRACGRCRFFWLDPRPLRDEIPKLYQQYHTHTPESGAMGVLGSWRSGTRDALLRALFGYRDLPRRPVHLLVAGLLACIGPVRDWAGGNVMWVPGTARGRLLDVGCGAGRFLADMKALGWQVAGVEFDPRAVETARTHFGLEVRTGSVHDAGFPAGSFDAVTLSHVIEHLPDPVETLSKCRDLLKPGGTLVMATPNPESLCRRAFGREWRGWEIPRHLFVYSTAALRTIAERSGLRVQSVFTTAKAAAWHWHAVRGGEGGKLLRLARKAEAVLFGLFGSNLARVGPLGEEVVLIARR